MNTTHRSRFHLDVALSHFPEEFADDPTRALDRLQFLLLDEPTCRARVAWLESLRDAAGKPLIARTPEDIATQYAGELALLGDDGVFAALAAGRLTPEWVDRLARLLRDPDALLVAHRRLVGDDGPAAADQPTSVGVDTAVHRGRRDLVADLQPWLPILLVRAGLADAPDDRLAHDFFHFLRPLLGDVEPGPLRDRLPDWLTAFADEKQLLARLRRDRLHLTAADVQADAVARVLHRGSPTEPSWATDFRKAALAAKLATPQDLLAFPPPGPPASALPNYRRDLFREALRAAQDGLQLFEFEATA